MEPEIKVSEKPESQPKANMLRQLILINFMFFRKKYIKKKKNQIPLSIAQRPSCSKNLLQGLLISLRLRLR